jgi:two-component system, OmpR family, aerobic respiration control sensor histidine kinase ArcB
MEHLNTAIQPEMDDDYIFRLEQKNAHLQAKLKDLESVIALMPGHVYLKDRNGDYKLCNDLQAKTFSYSASCKIGKDLLEKTDYEILSSGEASQVRAIDLEVMRSEKPYIVEEAVTLPDGSKAVFLSHKVPFYGNNTKKPTGILGISFDITDYKLREEALKKATETYERQEKQLKENMAVLMKEITGRDVTTDKTIEEYAIHIRDYFENIIAHTPGHLYWKDRHSRYLGCNDNMAKTVGLNSRLDVIGKTDHDLPWKEKAHLLIKNDKEVMDTGIPQAFEESGHRADGSLLVGYTNKTPLKNHAGEVTGILGISLDISDRKIMEEKLKIAKKRAEKANSAKTEFIKNMQHDIRTPLSGVFGMANILLTKENDPQKREDLDDLMICAKELLDYFNDIIDFSNIEANSLPLIHKKFHFKTLLSKLIKLETPAANAKQLKLHYEHDEHIPDVVIGDNFRLYRVLVNLVSNAIKFTKTGFIRIATAVLSEDADKRKVIINITIEDTGIGISENHQDYIYEKFSRLNPSNQGKYRGLGLGLKIVKQFIADLDGDIEVESTLGKGSIFSCTLPFTIPLEHQTTNKGKRHSNE